MLKRLFDIVVSGLALILLSPILLIFAWRIKSFDKGPVFYRGERVGLHGHIFRIYKFRSMIVDAEKTGVSSTSKGDSRITPVGHLLRKTKLDELPQLINVFVSDMSIVGPRPEVKKFTDMYEGEEKKLLDIRPGITDYASIWNSDEGEILKDSKDPDGDYARLIRPEKLRLQLRYYHEMSLLVDIKIMFLTARKILLKK
jgi:lipopolysaccharide/colanic/teichoic acid biosynthesis glycosyltransferase